MQGDNLLQEWRQAKETCYKIIQIAKDANIHGKTHLSRQSNKEFLAVYEYLSLFTKHRLPLMRQPGKGGDQS